MVDDEDKIGAQSEQEKLFQAYLTGEDITSLGLAAIAKIFESDPNIIYIFDIQEQNVSFQNRHVVDVLGYTPTEIKELGSLVLLKMAHPNDISRMEEHLERLQSSTDENILEIEYRVRHRDGSWRWLFSRHAVFKRGKDGRVLQIIGAATDITKHKEAVEELRASQAQLAGIMSSAMDAIISVNEAQHIVFFNAAAEKMFGCPADEAVGSPIDRFIPQRFRTEHSRHIQRFAQSGKTNRKMGQLGRLWGLRANGEEFPIEASISQAKLAGQDLYTVILRDITERMQAEESRRYQTLVLKSISDAVITTDLEFSILSWNSAAEALYGWRAEEVIGKRMGEVVYTRYISTEAEVVFRHFQAEGRWQGEVVQKHKGGHDIHVFASVNLVRDENGRPISVLAINRDITKRKLVELALQESEKKLQLFIEHAPASLAMFDREMRYLAYSHRWLLDYGLEDEDILGRSHYDVFPEIPDRWRAIHHRGLEGEVIRADEDPFVRTNGKTQWLRWEVRPWYMADQTIGGIVIFTEDITEAKKTREALYQSEIRYRAIVEDQTELIVRFRVDGTILFANEAYARVFGGTSESLLGQKIWLLLEESVAENLKNKIGRLTPEDPAGVNEHRLIMSDGRIMWLRWIDRGIFDEDGRLLEVQAVGYDITERHEAEEKLRQSKTQLQRILYSVPEGVLLLSADGDIHMTNPVADQFLAILAPQLGNSHLTQLGNRPLPELLTSPPKGLWHEIVFADHVFEAIARPVEPDLENSGWVLVLRDVTQERDIQQHLQQQERLAAVGQLASGIAHDFNNIMAVIILYSQLILRSIELPQKTREKMITIEEQAKRATDLIQQILDFSRQSVMEQKPLDLLPFMKEFVKLLARTLPEHIQIELTCDEEAFLIKADLSRIQQVMMNLSLNARDAMPDGGRLTISLAHFQTAAANPSPVLEMPPGNWVQIQVTDNGSGIAKQDLPKIFEPFFTTKEVGAGTGLGLAQVYGIMERHEGFIDVSSQEGEGTTFSLYFPSLDRGENGDLKYNRTVLQSGRGEMILLVEDNEATRQALMRSLMFLNYRVIEVTNGREALNLLKTEAAEDIDLIVSDVVMPEMSGIALLHAIRQQALTIPVILLTGHPLGDELEKMQTVGLAGWLPKPPDLENLSQLLAQALKGKNLQ